MSDQRQRLLDVAQAEGRLTSVVAAVFDRYGAVWAGGAGMVPGLDGQYRIGSITKTLTAVLVMQARDDGLLDLSDDLGDHLGDVGYADVTLRDVLAHSSGMQSEPRGPWWERTEARTSTRWSRANDGTRSCGRGRGVVPLLQPRLRPARRGRGPPVRRHLAPAGGGSTARPARDARRRRTCRGRARSRAGASTTSPGSGSTSR